MPINLAASVMQSLIETGTVTRGFLGISAQAVPSEDAEALGLAKGTRGVLILEVTPGAPADKAGLKRGDVVLSIEGKGVTSWEDLRLIIAETTPGTKVKLAVSRNGKPLLVEALLAKYDEKPDELIPGVNVTALTPEVRRRNNLPARLNGLMVTSVADDSPYRDQLVPNVLIVQIDREDATDLASAKAALNPGRHMLYVFYHGGMRVVRLDVE